MATPISTTVPYLSATELVDRSDVRNILQLVRDDNTPAVVGDLATSAVLAACLMDATGDIEAACVVGGRYAPDTLALLASGVTVAGARLKRLCADLAVFYLFDRRAVDIPQNIVDNAARAEKALEDLRDGSAMFATAENVAASQPTNRYMTETDFQRQNLISNNSRFFGARQNSRRRP